MRRVGRRTHFGMHFVSHFGIHLSNITQWGFGEGGGEEFRLQEDQELSVVVTTRQLILKMSSEYQTVDHTNKIIGIDHGKIFV